MSCAYFEPTPHLFDARRENEATCAVRAKHTNQAVIGKGTLYKQSTPTNFMIVATSHLSLSSCKNRPQVNLNHQSSTKKSNTNAAFPRHRSHRYVHSLPPITSSLQKSYQDTYGIPGKYLKPTVNPITPQKRPIRSHLSRNCPPIQQ